jgi:4'-phosphopantetheinyl transferase EntD
VGKDREPIWPVGITGSISHAEGYCGVAVARKTQIKSLGLDVELTGKLSRDSWRQICTRQELSLIDSLSLDKQQDNATLIFSAKECLYKCQYIISKKWLDFHDVMITANLDIGEFEATFLVNVGSSFKRGTRLKGKYLFCRGYVSTGMSIPTVRN